MTLLTLPVVVFVAQCTRVEVFGHKISEWYLENPDCKLQYRSATLMPPDSKGRGMSTAAVVKSGNHPTLITEAGELPILKMTEKYGRNPKVDAYEVLYLPFPLPLHKSASVSLVALVCFLSRSLLRSLRLQDPARVTYMIEDQTIHAQHHYAPGRITACSRVYHKQSGVVDLTVTDPFAPPIRAAQLDADLRTAVQMEKDCISAIKSMQRTMADVLAFRAKYVPQRTFESVFTRTLLYCCCCCCCCCFYNAT